MGWQGPGKASEEVAWGQEARQGPQDRAQLDVVSRGRVACWEQKEMRDETREVGRG